VEFGREVTTFLRNLLLRVLSRQKLEAANSSETFVYFYQKTRRHIQEASNICYLSVYHELKIDTEISGFLK
jgi:hypothetical protein